MLIRQTMTDTLYLSYIAVFLKPDFWKEAETQINKICRQKNVMYDAPTCAFFLVQAQLIPDSTCSRCNKFVQINAMVNHSIK